jgi:hypothetical protein
MNTGTCASPFETAAHPLHDEAMHESTAEAQTPTLERNGSTWLYLRFTMINRTKQYALYNFLSTLSGTHYVTPRAETVELGLHF